MSLEARIEVLEEKYSQWDKVLTGLEGTVSLILEEQMNLRKDTLVRFMEVDKSFKGIDRRFEGIDQRFDKIEEVLAIIVDRLPKR
ncbi:MAG: hypothetical protein ACR2PX_17210 [Endozoicomonas sp.]|uniref:hypothetical protein n=1 Tax=Endozoicomonas sp. TaxID=1892382 RepID=UPI003D9AC9FD